MQTPTGNMFGHNLNQFLSAFAGASRKADESVLSAPRYGITDAVGRTLVCSGDTGECPAMEEIARDADLLFLECAFPNGRGIPGHLDPDGVTRIVKASGARQVVLTHFYPECDRVDIAQECRKTYSGPLVLAEDLMRIEVRRN